MAFAPHLQKWLGSTMLSRTQASFQDQGNQPVIQVATAATLGSNHARCKRSLG